MVKLGRMEREFKPPNSVAIAGRIGELAVSVMRSIKFLPLSYMYSMSANQFGA